MAIPEWPTSLPDKPLREAYEELRAKNIIRTKMDKGPAKVRRLQSKAPTPLPGITFSLSTSQLDTLETFVSDTLGEGVYRFSWQHPRTDEVVELRFLPASDEALYSIRPMGGNNWEISCKMEVLP